MKVYHDILKTYCAFDKKILTLDRFALSSNHFLSQIFNNTWLKELLKHLNKISHSK